MEIYVLRHAAAAPVEQFGDDSQRPLTAEGIKKFKRAAKGMALLELDLDFILTSPYARALETAQIAARALQMKDKVVIAPELASGASPVEILALLRSHYSKCRGVLLVGHEPDLSNFISKMISGRMDCPVRLKKGALCKLSAGELNASHRASLEWLLTQSMLGALTPLD